MTRIKAIALSLLAASVLISCTAVNQFPEYVGVDILASRGLTLDGPSGADAYLLGATPAFDYIDLQMLNPAEYGTAPPDGTDVYRLEVPTLLPGGDFEAGIGAWATSPGPTPPAPTAFALASAGDMPDGDYLSFDMSPNAWGRLDLSAFSDGFVPDATYHVQFDTKRTTSDISLVYDYGDDTTESYLNTQNKSWEFEPTETGAVIVESFPGNDAFDRPSTFAAATEGTDYFYVGTPAGSPPLSTGFVDNLRFGRVDVLPHRVLSITETDVAGLALVAGRYEFSLYVKSEIAGEITPTSPDNYRSGQVTIGINDEFTTFTRAVEQWDDSTWVQVSVTFDLLGSDIASATPLRIQITPSSNQTPSIGSVLITAPRLELQI